MSEWLGGRFGNPSGAHASARAARAAVDQAREVLAGALGADPAEVVFTSGGTEADNMAVFGAVRARGGLAVCSAVEHDAVLNPTLASGGTTVPVGPDGIVDLARLESALSDDVAVVSVMLANNETGVVQPLAEVADVVRRRAPRAVVHTDAVQAFCWLDVAGLAASADTVAISGHKFGGPQGVGALLVRGGTKLVPLTLGGGQERERRPGTHNVAGIVGLAAAARAAVETRRQTVQRVSALRDRLADGLLAAVPGAVETGARSDKVAGACHLRFPGVESEELLFLLDAEGIAASAGSACASGATEPSHVLTAMGLTPQEARGAIRFSLGWCSTDADVDAALRVVPRAVARLGVVRA